MKHLGNAVPEHRANGTATNFISWHRLAEMLMRAGEQDPRYRIEQFYLDNSGKGLVYTVGETNE